jgi:hypothetical protein
LETTVIGSSGGTDEAKQGEPPALSELREKLDEKTKESKGWGTFARAIQIASADIAQNAEKFGAGNPGFQIIDLDEAREEGIMPIPAGQ